MKGKLLMFAYVSLQSFAYVVDLFCFPAPELIDIYKQNKINKSYIYWNLTNTDTCSISFIFVCELSCSLSEENNDTI